MRISSDVMLILESEPEAKAVLLGVAERLGCDCVESNSAGLREVLVTRRPSIAVLPVDCPETNVLAALDVLGQQLARPLTLLVGTVSPRLLASLRRAAESRGVPIAGVYARPLDAIAVEQLFTPHLTLAPPILREELEQALAEHEFRLVYQPKLSVTDGVTIQGVEALVRWQHPRRGLLPPRHFLTAVEEFGLMTQMTDFVMTEAVRQSGLWRSRGVKLEIVVNLSTRLVQDREFPDRLAILLQENDFPPQQLVLDVTESLHVQDQNLLLDVFTRLRMLGVGLSLDNFGTGSSSLMELYRMPFSEIKVDHSLIADVPFEPEARVIVKAMVDLAHTLKLNVCAEGVETRQMLEFVRSAGFDFAQGRFLCEPVQAGEVEHIVASWPNVGPASMGSWRPEKGVEFNGTATTIRTRRLRNLKGKFAT